MTPDQFRATLAALEPLGLSARRLAALWGYASENSIRNMRDGKQRVPDDLAAWLLALRAWWERHPAE